MSAVAVIFPFLDMCDLQGRVTNTPSGKANCTPNSVWYRVYLVVRKNHRRWHGVSTDIPNERKPEATRTLLKGL